MSVEKGVTVPQGYHDVFMVEVSANGSGILKVTVFLEEQMEARSITENMRWLLF